MNGILSKEFVPIIRFWVIFFFDSSSIYDNKQSSKRVSVFKPVKILVKIVFFQNKKKKSQMKMSTHEDDDQDQDQEINVDSDSRLSCGSNSDVDMDGDGSCYDSETALG